MPNNLDQKILEDGQEEKNWFVKNKKLTMQGLVFVIAAVIFIFWVVNLKHSWQLSGLQEADYSKLEQAKQEFGGMIDELAKEAQNVVVEEPEKDLLIDNVDIVEPANDTIDLTESINLVDENNLATSSCPAWINCMPRIVGSGDPYQGGCNIPPGCEDITQIAY